MKIYFVVRSCFPNGLATTARVLNYCKGFLDNEIPCEVIIPVAIERHEEPIKNTEYKGVFDGIPFQYISKNPRRSRFLLYRKVKDVFDYIKTLFYLLNNLAKDDIVLVYEGGCKWFKFLSIVAHMKQSHIVMELNELPYGTGSETPQKKKLRNKMLKDIFPLFDGFITISETLSQLVRQFSPESRIIKVPIIVDTSIPSNITQVKDIKRPYLFHSGTLTEQKDGVSGMLEAFAIANKKLGYKLDYVFTGYLEKSKDYTLIKHTIEKYNIKDYVHFLGYLSNEELKNYQSNCLATIINKFDNQQNKYCFSTKLGEYLIFKKPIIITDVGEAMFYLNNDNSYIVEPCNTQLIAEKIIAIVNNPSEAKKKGIEGYRLANEVFNYKYQAKRLVSFFYNLKSDYKDC